MQSNEDCFATPRAEPRVGSGEGGQEVAAGGRLWQQLRARGGEQISAEGEFGLAVTVGEEAVIADALQADGDYVLEEEADKVIGGDGHHFKAAGVAIIFVLEGNAAILEGQQAAVGNGHAMSVAAEIFQDVQRSAKGRFGINHPFLVMERSQVAGKGGGVAERCQIAEELEFAGGISVGESL